MSPLLRRQPARWQPGDLLPPAGLHGVCQPEGGAESGRRAGGQGDISEEGYIQKEALGETAMNVTVICIQTFEGPKGLYCTLLNVSVQ